MNNEYINVEQPLFDNWKLVGMLATPLRWVTGWVFFSAFWRRVVLAPAKLDPNSAAYVGHKFNHFLPHALWIKPMLQYLLLHLDGLYAFLIVFTVIEGLVGLALLLGLGTRLAGLGATLLSWGILMGAGWLGTTCLDEWQIGASGIAAGLTLILTGAGPWSLDGWWQRRWPSLANISPLRWLSSGPLSLRAGYWRLAPLAAVLAAIAIGWALYTNQAFAGGVVGKLHNPSKKPHLALSQPALNSNGDLQLTLFRDGGPDTYGAFIVDVSVKDSAGQVVENFDAGQLAALSTSAIDNRYPVKVQPGAYSLMVPLGSLARVNLEPGKPTTLSPGTYQIELTDVSGLNWSIAAKVQ
jgi:uncharacterized membrane protein YphA (DoxX/SURF4 family)